MTTEFPVSGPTAYTRRLYIESEEALREIVPVLADADAIGVDIEMGQRVRRKPGGVQEWIHILALVQIAGNGLSVVIDPLRCSVTPLAGLMAGGVRKVFLGGGQDAALLAKSGIEPLNIADVGEVALSIFGRREDGMAALTQRIFGISLDKTVRRADWMVRPLNPALIAYAYQDAELTLDIYRWFQEEHPDVLAAHERRRLEPVLSAATSEWLRLLTSRNAPDAAEVLKLHGLDRERDEAVLVAEIRAPLRENASPRQVNKLLRAAAELRLKPLLSEVLPLLGSQSSLVRASAARAVARLAESQDVAGMLESTLSDPMPEVQKAAQTALKEARATALRSDGDGVANDEDIETGGLGDESMSALAQLKAQLEASET